MFDLATFRKIYSLACPYGRKRMLVVASLTCLQGIVQTVGVSSIFPFLAIAADPRAVRDSPIGGAVLQQLPEMSDRTLLIVAGLGAIAMLLVANGLHLLTVYATATYSRGFGHWLQIRLLRQVLAQDYSYFLQHSTAVMLKKVSSDVVQFIQGVLIPLFNATAGIVNIALLAIMLLLVDPVVAVAAGLTLGSLYMGIFGLLSGHRREISRTMKETTRETTRQAQQLLGGVKPIKVHGAEPHFILRFSDQSLRQANVQAKLTVHQAAPKTIIEPVALGALVSIILYYTTRGHSLTDILPTLGLIAMASYRMLPNIQSLYVAASIFSANLHTLDEVYEEFDPETRTAATTASTEKASPLSWSESISLRELGFRYPSGLTNTINSISLTIPKNTSVAFVGSTGCGKSTLIDLILGLHTPSAGGIYIDKTRLDNTNLANWRAGIGYVPQDIFLLDDTIAANVALGQPADQIDYEQLRRACTAAQLLDFIEQELHDGWQTQVGERGVRLSGGQRQRIGLARALYHRPEVLILDEATSALDQSTEADVMMAIAELEGKLTMIIVAHRLSTIQWCDQVVELNRGRVVKISNHKTMTELP